MSNESFGHQYAILLRNYGIAFSQLLFFNIFDRSFFNTTDALLSSPSFFFFQIHQELKKDSVQGFKETAISLSLGRRSSKCYGFEPRQVYCVTSQRYLHVSAQLLLLTDVLLSNRRGDVFEWWNFFDSPIRCNFCYCTVCISSNGCGARGVVHVCLSPLP